MLVILLVTGDLIAAFSIGFATETVQFINYFVYETIWTNYHDKRLRIKIERTREVDIKLKTFLLNSLKQLLMSKKHMTLYCLFLRNYYKTRI
jgi:uncharacterized membrane protein